MSKRLFNKRGLITALTCGVLLSMFAPNAAMAQEIPIFAGDCVEIPVTTPGVTALGQHVPSLTHIEVCAFGSGHVSIFPPKVTSYPNCGTPCFDIRADLDPVVLYNSAIVLTVRWREDDIEKYPGPVNPITIPIDGADDPRPRQEVCLIAVGDPTPPCDFPLR